MQQGDWWRDFVISVPRPIPPGYMVGMRDEVRDGEHYVVEFLEKVPGYQPNPFSQGKRGVQPGDDNGDDGEVVVSWSRESGLVVLDGRSI